MNQFYPFSSLSTVPFLENLFYIDLYLYFAFFASRRTFASNNFQFQTEYGE